MNEVELVVNSRPPTVGTLNDVDSISPCNLLPLKSSVVMPSPGEFIPPDLYFKKR